MDMTAVPLPEHVGASGTLTLIITLAAAVLGTLNAGDDSWVAAEVAR